MMRGTAVWRQRLAILAGLGVVAITTLQFVAARFSLREHLTAIDIVSLRFSGAALIFLPVIWKIGTPRLRTLGWRRAAVLALLVGLPYPLIINQGLAFAPAAHAAALSPASVVFFSYILSRLMFGEKASGLRLVSLGAVIAGLLLFVFHAGIGAGRTLTGDLLFALSGIMFAAYAVLVRLWSVNAVTATIAVVLISCLPLPIFHAIMPSGFAMASLLEIGVQFVIQGFLAGALAIILYTYAVRELGPQRASLFMPCVPITTTLVGMVALGEIPAPAQLVGIAIMTAGMVLPFFDLNGSRRRAAGDVNLPVK